MKLPRPNKPPVTSNPRAQRLIADAQANCATCRTNWRLKTGTFRHAEHGSSVYVQCTAIAQRRALRNIAAERQGK